MSSRRMSVLPLRNNIKADISQYEQAKMAYTRVLDQNPNHAKVLQQLGWLYHQQSTEFSSQEQAIDYLEKSVSADNTDAQSWYLLGRCYMSQQKYPKAYEAYQQAVYRDGRNPTFWCSIGVLYYQINQYRDALDAYSRAIRLNPNISEVWYDLGTLVSRLDLCLIAMLIYDSTSLATTKQAMPWMLMQELPTSIPQTNTSKLDWHCLRDSQRTACQTAVKLHCHKTSIHKRINREL